MPEIHNNKAFALLAGVLIMALLMMLSLYLTGFIIGEIKISNSHAASIKTYYLAESGISEAIWRLKNTAWKEYFESNPVWSATITRNSVLYDNGSYTVEITNSDEAKAEIISTATLDLGFGSSQRVIKADIYKALGDPENPTGEATTLTSGNITVDNSTYNSYNGGLSIDGNLLVRDGATVNSDGDILASNNINVSWDSQVNAPYTQEFADVPDMPSISISDRNNPNSFYNRATVRYSGQEFKNMLANTNHLILPGPITYVENKITIDADTDLTINGILVTDRIFEMGYGKFGDSNETCCQDETCNKNNLTINKIEGEPAGLIAEKNINFLYCINGINAEGLIYSPQSIEFKNTDNENSFNISGAVIGKKVDSLNTNQGVNITRNDVNIGYIFGDPEFSPIITVDHWEEEY